MSYGAKQYKQTSVTTASRGQILIMLYEAAIRNLRQATECIKVNDVPGKSKHILKAHDIVNELSATLDFKVGGQIAVDLERLYVFCMEQLFKANVENSIPSIEAVDKVLSNLLEGWRQAVSKLENGAGGEKT